MFLNGQYVSQSLTGVFQIGQSADAEQSLFLRFAFQTVCAGEEVEIRGGRYIFDNGTSGEAITSAMIGSSAKVIDIHTVGCSGGAAGIVAGTILDVTSDGVVIQIH